MTKRLYVLLGCLFVALVSQRGGARREGASLGVQIAASSLGQAIGPVAGGALFIWQRNAPYLMTGAALLAEACTDRMESFCAGGARPACAMRNAATPRRSAVGLQLELKH